MACTMKEIFKKLQEAGRKDAFDSLENLTAAAKDLGYTEEQLDEALDGFKGFPLDDDDLEEITGGFGIAVSITNTSKNLIDF